MYYDLLMNQGYKQEISRGMHNFPSPPAPTPTLKQLFHALYIKLAAYMRADVSSISFINMLRFPLATKEVGGICMQASLPLSAFSCLFSEHTAWSTKDHMSLLWKSTFRYEKEKGSCFRKKLFQRNKQA